MHNLPSPTWVEERVIPRPRHDTVQLIHYGPEVTNMTYDPTTPIDLVFGKIDDLLMYIEFSRCAYCASYRQGLSLIISSTVVVVGLWSP